MKIVVSFKPQVSAWLFICSLGHRTVWWPWAKSSVINFHSTILGWWPAVLWSPSYRWLSIQSSTWSFLKVRMFQWRDDWWSNRSRTDFTFERTQRSTECTKKNEHFPGHLRWSFALEKTGKWKRRTVHRDDFFFVVVVVVVLLDVVLVDEDDGRFFSCSRRSSL